MLMSSREYVQNSPDKESNLSLTEPTQSKLERIVVILTELIWQHLQSQCKTLGKNLCFYPLD